jgi:hypothetical protein
VLELDTEQLNAKPIRIKLKAGFYITGIIQMGAAIFCVVTWFDKQNLIPGDDWEMRIEQAIEKSDFFLLFLSRKTEEKIGFRNREIQLAIKQQSYHPRGHIFLIPILLDDCTPPHDLRGLNWLKATDDKWFDRLVDVVALPYGNKLSLLSS